MAVHESQRVQGLKINLTPGQNDVSLIFLIIERPAAGFPSYDMAGTGAGLFIMGVRPCGPLKIIVCKHGTYNDSLKIVEALIIASLKI